MLHLNINQKNLMKYRIQERSHKETGEKMYVPQYKDNWFFWSDYEEECLYLNRVYLIWFTCRLDAVEFLTKEFQKIL